LVNSFRHGITYLGLNTDVLQAVIKDECTEVSGAPTSCTHIYSELSAGMFRWTGTAWKQQCYVHSYAASYMKCSGNVGNTECNKWAYIRPVVTVTTTSPGTATEQSAPKATVETSARVHEMRKRLILALTFATAALALFAMQTLAIGDDNTLEGTDDDAVTEPTPTSEEVLVDSSFDPDTLIATNIYQYDSADGVCTHVIRAVIPYFAARNATPAHQRAARADEPPDDGDPDAEVEVGESLSCGESPESLAATRRASGSDSRGLAAPGWNRVVVQLFAFGDDLVIVALTSSEVARVAVVDDSVTRKAAKTRTVAATGGRVAPLVLQAPDLADPAAGALQSASEGPPPPPQLSIEATALRLVAYDRRGKVLARVPVFPESR
jgi:hypothetical protein